MSNLHHKTTLAPISNNPTLHVVAVVSNPVGYLSRYALFEDFHKHMRDQNVHLTVVEAAYGDRAHVVPLGDQTIQLRTNHELWHKENMINVGISRLPTNWQYVAWVDADVHFTNPHWVNQTVQALQHYAIIQPWSDAIDLGPNAEPIQTHKSFAGLYAQGKPLQFVSGGYPYDGKFGHPGFAWAARRDAIDHLGGLVDWTVTGAGDHHMALALVGSVDKSVPGNVTPNYIGELRRWQDRAEKYIRRNVGYIGGTLTHAWHGRKKDRQYEGRWSIITKYQFDPLKDIKKDWQGLYQLVDHGDLRSIQLRDALRRYFRSRNEDSIDNE